MNGERAALFQHAQRLRKKSLFILTLDVMIDIIARHGVEHFVRKVKFYGVSSRKRYVSHPLRLCIAFTERQIERGVFLAPAVYADHLRVRIALCAGDRERPAAAADIQPSPSVRQCNVFRNAFYHSFRDFTFAVIRKSAIHIYKYPRQNGKQQKRRPKENAERDAQPALRRHARHAEHDT